MEHLAWAVYRHEPDDLCRERPTIRIHRRRQWTLHVRTAAITRRAHSTGDEPDRLLDLWTTLMDRSELTTSRCRRISVHERPHFGESDLARPGDRPDAPRPVASR